MVRAFTLIELMVVTAIILIVSAIAVPSIASLMSIYEQQKAVASFESLLATAQATARSHFTPVALRIERAFKTDERGRMVLGPAGKPIWLDHQQIRLLVFAGRRPQFGSLAEQLSFRQLPDTNPTQLTPSFWLAPDYARSSGFDPTVPWQPTIDPDTQPINTLDTFYLVWNRQGELFQLPARRIVYLDATQDFALIDHPYPSALSVIGYERDAYEHSNGNLAVLETGLPLYVNRYIGSLVLGEY